MCRTLKAVIAVALIFLMTPKNRCSGARYTSSVKKFQCQNQSRDIVIPGTPNITMGTTYCEDYIFDEKKMGKVVRLFVEDFSHQFDLKYLDIWSMLRGLHIEVSIIPRVVTAAYDMSGTLIKSVPVSGLALSKSEIWVEVKTNQIWATSQSVMNHQSIINQ